MKEMYLKKGSTFIAKNPVGITGIGDPFILRAKDGIYYLYATTMDFSSRGFYCWQSRDLRNWSEGKACYEINEDSFGCCDYWAPEVVEYNGRYIMHYSARNDKGSLRIGVAVSDSPAGPFRDVNSKKPMFDLGYATIDGHVFLDDDGKKYFYFARDCSENIVNGRHESHIYVAEMSDDLLELKGEPIFLLSPTESYETIAHTDSGGETFVWNEGPFMLKRKGKYHLMYSANFFASHDYCICAAVSDNPTGNFKKYPHPVATYIKGKVSGPGHNSVFTSNGGETLCAYHVHTFYDKPSGNRQLFIDKISWRFGKIELKITAPANPLP